jgi:hypothetical protein
VLFLKRRVLLPLTRWLFEYSRDNFERQARVNETLMASIETLVVEVVSSGVSSDEGRARAARVHRPPR